MSKGSSFHSRGAATANARGQIYVSSWGRPAVPGQQCQLTGANEWGCRAQAQTGTEGPGHADI